MPTSKPRITVTLTEYQHAILRKISDSGGLSMSSVISEFMVAAQPTLEKMADAFQQLKQDRYDDHQRVADLLTGLHAERNRNDSRDHMEPRAQRVEKKAEQAAQAGQGTIDTLFPTPETADPARLTTGSADAIQYCASVDTVRPDSHNSRDSGSPWEEVQDDAMRGNKKTNVSRKTKGRKK